MPSIDTITYLLIDNLARKLFTAIVEKGRMYGKELIELSPPDSREQVYATLDKLKERGIIQVDAEGPIADFRTYYITSEGLTTQRELKRISASAPGT